MPAAGLAENPNCLFFVGRSDADELLWEHDHLRSAPSELVNPPCVRFQDRQRLLAGRCVEQMK
jgi:hypothetical protein